MMVKLFGGFVLVALACCGGPAAAADCRKVSLDSQHRSAPIGASPSIRNLGAGEVYISLASDTLKDLSSDPNDLVRVTGFVLGPGDAVGGESHHMVISVDGSPYIVQLVKGEAPATVEICGQP